MGRKSRYSSEVRERAVRMVLEHDSLCYTMPIPPS